VASGHPRQVYGGRGALGVFGARGLPGFGVLPAGVGGVVEVQQQALAAIEEAEAEDVVPDQRELRDEKTLHTNAGQERLTLPAATSRLHPRVL